MPEIISNKIALCLAGGGARGIIQYGFIKAWLELGLQYDICFGTSVGALNGALLHAGEFAKLEELWKNIGNKDVYTWNLFDLYRLNKDKPGIYNSDPLLKTIKKALNYKAIMNNPKDFWINATDYFGCTSFTKESKTMSEEDLALFLKASANPPIFFEPVEFEGRTLVDGGLTSNYNIDDALLADVETVVLMSPTYQRKAKTKISGILEVIGDSITIPTHNQLDQEIGCTEKINAIINELDEHCQSKYKKIKLIKIVADKDFGFDLLDFDYKGLKRQVLIDYGYHYAKEILQRELCT
jgi:NTE family protein